MAAIDFFRTFCCNDVILCLYDSNTFFQIATIFLLYKSIDYPFTFLRCFFIIRYLSAKITRYDRRLFMFNIPTYYIRARNLRFIVLYAELDYESALSYKLKFQISSKSFIGFYNSHPLFRFKFNQTFHFLFLRLIN